MSLRQIEKLLIQTRISLKTVYHNYALFPDIFFFLNYLKYYDEQFYLKVRDKEIIVQDLPGKLEDWFLSINYQRTTLEIGEFELLFIFLYNNSRKDFPRLYDINTQQFSLNFSPKLSKFTKDTCVNILNGYETGYINKYDIDYLIGKVELIENLEF